MATARAVGQSQGDYVTHELGHSCGESFRWASDGRWSGRTANDLVGRRDRAGPRTEDRYSSSLALSEPLTLPRRSLACSSTSSRMLPWSLPALSPVPIELYPVLAFDSLFGDKAGKLQGSILDDVLEQANDLRGKGQRLRQSQARRVPVLRARDGAAGARLNRAEGSSGGPAGPTAVAGPAERLPRLCPAHV